MPGAGGPRPTTPPLLRSNATRSLLVQAPLGPIQEEEHKEKEGGCSKKKLTPTAVASNRIGQTIQSSLDKEKEEKKQAKLRAAWAPVVLLLHRLQVCVFLAQTHAHQTGGGEGEGGGGLIDLPCFLSRLEMGGSVWCVLLQKDRMDRLRKKQAAARVIWKAWSKRKMQG